MAGGVCVIVEYVVVVYVLFTVTYLLVDFVSVTISRGRVTKTVLTVGVVAFWLGVGVLRIGVVGFWAGVGVLRIRRLEFSVADEELRIGVVEFCAADEVLRIDEYVL
jgi:hypothetical protein